MNAFNQMNYQGYNTGMPTGAVPGGYAMPNTKTPLMTNPLTDEQRKLLAEKIDQFDLNVTAEELAYAICTHKRDGKYDVVPANDGTGEVICKTCHARFKPDVVTPEYVQETTDRVLNVMQTLKLIAVDMNVDVIKQYFAMIPYLKRIPKLYKLENSTFQQYQQTTPIQDAGGPNIYGMYNAITNPAVAFAPNMGMGASPMGGYGYQQPMTPYMGQQQQMVGGFNPLYQQAPMGQQAAPMTPPFGAPQAAPQQPVSPEMQAAINQAVANTVASQQGGQKPAETVVKEKVQL